MARVILRHLTGSKAGTADEFPLVSVAGLMLGRDPVAQVSYDPEQDDLVSRQHARIVRDASDPVRFTLMDLASRNGTFLNTVRINGTVPLASGDVIQLGAGGPKLAFEFEPVTDSFVVTRVAAPGTR